MKTQKFKLPFVVEAQDSRSFPLMEDFLRDLTGNNKIKVVQITFEDESDGRRDYDEDQTRLYWKRKLHIVPKESPMNHASWFYHAVVYEGKQPDIKDILKCEVLTWA